MQWKFSPGRRQSTCRHHCRNQRSNAERFPHIHVTSVLPHPKPENDRQTHLCLCFLSSVSVSLCSGLTPTINKSNQRNSLSMAALHSPSPSPALNFEYPFPQNPPKPPSCSRRISPWRARSRIASPTLETRRKTGPLPSE